MAVVADVDHGGGGVVPAKPRVLVPVRSAVTREISSVSKAEMRSSAAWMVTRGMVSAGRSRFRHQSVREVSTAPPSVSVRR